MATRAYHSGNSSSFIWSTGGIASRVATHWRRWRTQRMIENLPADIRKDIGWPTTGADDRHQQF